ncbi:MAG TPA: hypothetical protein VFZ63_11225 [Jiangellaceae bacterium]
MSESDFRPNEPDDALTSDDIADAPDDAPEADAVEQQRTVVDEDDGVPPSVPFDVDPADAYEQNRVVDYDEDEYR